MNEIFSMLNIDRNRLFSSTDSFHQVDSFDRRVTMIRFGLPVCLISLSFSWWDRFYWGFPFDDQVGDLIRAFGWVNCLHFDRTRVWLFKSVGPLFAAWLAPLCYADKPLLISCHSKASEILFVQAPRIYNCKMENFCGPLIRSVFPLEF